MADPIETVDTPPAPTPEPAAPAAAAPPPLTMEVVQRMIEEAAKKAYDSGAAAARRAVTGKPPKAATPPTTETPPADAGADALTAIALRDNFDDATEGLTLTAAQKKFIRKNVMANVRDPEQVGSYVIEMVEAMGVGKAPPSAPAPATTTPPTVPNSRPAAMPAPAAPSATSEGDPAFRALTDEAATDAWQAYVRRKGANPGNPYDPRNRAAWRELRNQFEREAAITRIALGARRG